MKTNNLHNIEALFDETFGPKGTEYRDSLESNAQAFAVGQIILDARKQEKVTQSELATRIGTNKSYISKIENGKIEPSAGVFLRIISALGLRFEVLRPVIG